MKTPFPTAKPGNALPSSLTLKPGCFEAPPESLNSDYETPISSQLGPKQYKTAEESENYKSCYSINFSSDFEVAMAGFENIGYEDTH